MNGMNGLLLGCLVVTALVTTGCVAAPVGALPAAQSYYQNSHYHSPGYQQARTYATEQWVSSVNDYANILDEVSHQSSSIFYSSYSPSSNTLPWPSDYQADFATSIPSPPNFSPQSIPDPTARPDTIYGVDALNPPYPSPPSGPFSNPMGNSPPNGIFGVDTPTPPGQSSVGAPFVNPLDNPLTNPFSQSSNAKLSTTSK